MSIKTILDLWDKFWFSEASALPVAAFRAAFGFIISLFILLLSADIFVWFGKEGITSNQTVRNYTQAVGLNILNFAKDNDTFLVVFFIVFFLAALSMMVGYKTRWSVIICWLCMNSLYHRNPFLFNSGDTYIRVTLFWLIFADSGALFSVDHYLASKGQTAKTDDKLVSIWPQRLLQLQLALVYFHTVVAKIWTDPWIDGTAVYISSRIEDLQRIHLPYVFEHLWTCQLLSWGTLIIEAALFSLIWIKELRYYVIALAVMFHLIIDLHMNIPLFEWLMIASYIVFIDGRDIERLFGFFKKRLSQNS